jgi:hypothetical protein
MLRRLALGVVLLAFLAGCSGSDRSGSSAATEAAPAPAEPAPTPPAEPAAPPAETSAPPADTGAAPSGSDDGREGIVRAWSEALNTGDNEAAANLFATPALVIQGDIAVLLENHEEAVQWNAGLPCSGNIVELATQGEIVTAVFELGDRTTSQCDAAPGTRAAAQFLIQDGKIVAWRQVPPPESLEPAPETGTGPEADEGAL